MAANSFYILMEGPGDVLYAVGWFIDIDSARQWADDHGHEGMCRGIIQGISTRVWDEKIREEIEYEHGH